MEPAKPAPSRGTVAGWIVALAIYGGVSLWNAERQRVRDVIQLRENAEIKALVSWAAIRCGSR